MGSGIVVLAVAGVLLGAGAAALVMARSPRAATVPAAAAVNAPGSAPTGAAGSTGWPTPGAPVVSSSSRPKWSGGVERVGRRTHVRFFEVVAENEVATWTRRVRPVLSVRCVGGTTEAYVLTEAAAAMEENRGTHTVSLAFDDAVPQKQAWFPSDDYQALFSPDAIALARRVAAAQTLRFGFTPYNGAPAVAIFDVRGFETHLRELAKDCRWK